MSSTSTSSKGYWLSVVLGLIFSLVAGLAGLASGLEPVAGLAIALTVLGLVVGLLHFEYAIVGLLILRSTMDAFSRQQIPAIFAVGLDAIVIIYFAILLLQKKDIWANKFAIFFTGFCALQSLWVLLVAFGALGGVGPLGDSIREWVRISSWCALYWLILQFRTSISPKRLINLLFWALCIPLIIASLQIFLPNILPADISPYTSVAGPPGEATGIKIRGTIGHPNTFATFIFFFISLTYWKLNNFPRKWFWASLLILLASFYVTAKALFSLGMLAVFLTFVVGSRITPLRALAIVSFFLLVIVLFGSSEFGQSRLESIANTPLLNPDIDISKAILLSKSDYNSFNWRLSQWSSLLEQWRHSPWLGYGIGLNKSLVANGLEPHNDYVRWLVDGGILGLSSMFVFWGGQYAHLISIARSHTSVPAQRDLCYVMTAMLTALLFGMLTENIWDHTLLFFYWYLLMAVISWDWNATPNESDTQDC